MYIKPTFLFFLSVVQVTESTIATVCKTTVSICLIAIFLVGQWFQWRLILSVPQLQQLYRCTLRRYFFSLSVGLVTVESKCPLDWVEYDNNCIQFNKDQHTWMDAGVSPAPLPTQGSTQLLLLLSSTKVLGVYYCMYI